MSTSVSSCDYLKIFSQSPGYSSIPITSGTNQARTQSVASTAMKLGSNISPSHMQLLTASNSDKNLVPRTTALNVFHIRPVKPEDEETERSLNTVRVECAMISLHGENHKDCPTMNDSLDISTGDINVGKIPPLHSRSGSPLLVTDGPNDHESSKILLQFPNSISLHNVSSSSNDKEERKQDLETDAINNIGRNSVHLGPDSDLDPMQETWQNDDLMLPNRFDEILVEPRDRNGQLCSAFQPVENSSKSIQSLSTSNQENAVTVCVSTSFHSAVTVLHVDGINGRTDKMLERSSLPMFDSARTRKTSGSDPYESPEQDADADNGRKLFCSKSWTTSPSKESDYNEKCEKFLEGGSTRNSTRTCSHCGTMKTPLWRSGPLGPKSLCNACGIRLKKEGRRIAIRDSTDESISPISSPKIAAKFPSKPLKRKLDKQNSFPVDSWFARARLKAALNHTPKLEKRRMFSTGLRKVQSGEAFCEKPGSINKKNHSSSPSTFPRETSACAHEYPVIYNDATSDSRRKRASSVARFEADRLDTPNPIRLRRSFSKDEEEGASLLMAFRYGLVNV